MLVWRRWIFPILMVLVFAVIAASLVRLAFFAPAAEGIGQPAVTENHPIVAVQKGSITNKLSLQGTVARDEEVTLRTPANGKVTAVHAKVGDWVSKGQAILTVKEDPTEDPGAQDPGTQDQSKKAGKQQAPAKYTDLLAPRTGKITELPATVDQMATAGEEAGKVSPNTFHILATVEPVQLYRLVGAPQKARVTIAGGPAPFSCKNLTTEVAEDNSTSVRCTVPKKRTVFSGLPVDLTVQVGSADDVLVIPATAVKGGSGDGLVWVVAEEGADPTERKVRLGISDGTNVEVIDGLEEGEQVLEFVPGSAAPQPEESCYEVAPGETQCDPGMTW
ncbi:MAG: efflux RND transporter periplasmic adaptor subunit [Actinobacteria bacterium]|nr:efflux RND transporter periplasmic adaptor subunit [Actinomycetota bacterium]